MGEIIETKPKTKLAAVGVEPHDIAKGFRIFWFAVGAQAHDFVFIAKFQKAKILRDRAVIEAKRMRESDGAVDVHAIAAADSPHGTGEIAESVGRKQGGVFKRRNKITAGEMSLMVFDAMKRGLDLGGIAVEGRSQCRGDSRKFGNDLSAFARKDGMRIA